MRKKAGAEVVTVEVVDKLHEEDETINALSERVGTQITDARSQMDVVGVLTAVVQQRKAVKALLDGVLGPLKEGMAKARAPYDARLARLEAMEREIKEALSGYQMGLDREHARVERERMAQEAKIRAQEEAGRLKPETAERKLASLAQNAPQAPQNSLRGANGGGVSFRTEYTVEIVNRGAIPAEFLVPDMVAIRAEAIRRRKAGEEQIPGVMVIQGKGVSSR